MLKQVDYFTIIKGTLVALILVVAAWFSQRLDECIIIQYQLHYSSTEYNLALRI